MKISDCMARVSLDLALSIEIWTALGVTISRSDPYSIPERETDLDSERNIALKLEAEAVTVQVGARQMLSLASCTKPYLEVPKYLTHCNYSVPLVRQVRSTEF